MSTLNIGGDKADASYRYKMPALVTKIEGRGNGIKTVILNMTDLAKSLHIHPAYPTKFFGIELGAQSKFSGSTDRAVVNGAHQPGDLAKILERFIAQFILCPVCKLPELKMSVKSSIKIDCAACGHNSTIKTTHKLAQYIIKNPPSALAEEEKRGGAKGKKVKVGVGAGGEEEGEGVEEKAEGKKKGGKREHKGKSKKKLAEGGEEGDGGDGEEGGEDGVAENGAAEENGGGEGEEEEEEVVKEKPKKKSKEKADKGGAERETKEASGEGAAATKAATSKAAKSPSSSSPSAKGGEDVWYTDTSKEAQQARKDAEFKGQRDAASASAIEAILASSKQDNKAEQPVTTLKIFLAQGQRSTEEVLAELKRLVLAKGLDQPAKVRLFLDAVTDIDAPANSKAVAATFHKYSAVLSSFTTDRATSVQFLCGVEELLGSTRKELLSAVPHVLKQLYDDDVCEEDSIVGWWESPPESSWLVKKEVAVAVRGKAKVFVDWLKTAEDDGEDEGEEGDEEEGEVEEDGDEDEEDK